MFISKVVKADWSKHNLPYRTPGIYGHLPKPGYRGYLRMVFPKTARIGGITIWYMGNPYRGKLVEVEKRNKCVKCDTWASEFLNVWFPESKEVICYSYPACETHAGRVVSKSTEAQEGIFE